MLADLLEGTGLTDTSGLVYHYTRASAALEGILESMTMRLTPVSDGNDPWESRTQAAGFHAEGEEGFPPDLFASLDRRVRRARRACFCRDDPDCPLDGLRRDYAKSCYGWARDRMWGQYADAHRGVCLWFNRDKLQQSAREALGLLGECIAAEVTYPDDDWPPKSQAIDMVALRDLGEEAYLRRQARWRFFEKRKDWEGEREYRILLLPAEGNPVAQVPIATSLVAIIIGHHFGRAYQPCIDAICERAKIKARRLLYSPHPHLTDCRNRSVTL